MPTTTLKASIPSPYIDLDAAATYLHFKNAASLRHCVRRLGIPHRRSGWKFLFVTTELDAWLKRRTVQMARRKAPTRRRKKTAA